MKALLLSTMLVMFTLFTMAQNFMWVNTEQADLSYGPSFWKSTLILDQDKNPVMAGFSDSDDPQGYGDVFIKKYDSNGNLLNQIVIKGKAYVPEKIDNDSGNNFYFFIKYKEDIVLNEDTIYSYDPGINVSLIKLDEEFNLVWSKHYEGPDLNYGGEFLVKINNEALFAAFRINNDTTRIEKLDLDGELLNSFYQAGSGKIGSFDTDTEGNFYVAGSCTGSAPDFNGTVFPNNNDYNVYLVKYDSAGSVQWFKNIEDVTCPAPQVFVSGPDHIYLAGPLSEETDLDDIHIDGPTWISDFFITRLNSAGDFLWANELPNNSTEITGDVGYPGSKIEAFSFITGDTDHNVYLSGFIRGTIDWGNGIVTENPNSNMQNDNLVWSYNPEGEMRFAVRSGGNGFDMGHSLVVKDNGTIFQSGMATDTSHYGNLTIEAEDNYYFIAKIDYNLTGIEEGKVVNKQLLVYPNPAKDFVEFKINEDVVINLFDISGRKIITQSFAAGESKRIIISFLKPGVYLSRVSGNGFSYSGKIVIE